MSLYSIGLSGLNTAQNALATVSHNMSNSATEGYTRQNTIIASANGQYTARGFFGQGSNTTTVIRVYDQFLTGQLRNAQSQSASLQTYNQQIAQIDNLLADQKGGLAPLMQKFFSAVQGVSDTPADPAARQAMLSSGQALVGQVRAAASFFQQLQDGVNTQIGTAVTQVNAYAHEIANLNEQIMTLKGASGGQPPNDLLDQRDQAVAELTKLVGAKVVAVDSGTYNITIGNGQPLVMGRDAYALKAVAAAADPTRTTIAYTLPNGQLVEAEEGAHTGGSLGGLLQYRTETLDTSQNAIGRLSLALGQSFNDQHKLGLDLNGAVGGDVFRLGGPLTLSNANNTGTALATTTITDTSALSTSDYTVGYDGTQYTLTRLSDNKVVASAAGSGAQTLQADGLRIDIGAGMQASDSFLVAPTRNAAASFDMAITDPAKVAAASPARVDAGATNMGSGTGSLTGVAPGFALPGKILATFDGTAYTFRDAGGNAVTPTATAANPAGGTDYTFAGLTFTFTGTPRAGDGFTLSSNSGAVSSNGNALALARLQNQPTVGGVSSFNDAFAQLVNEVGTKARTVQIASASQDSITGQIRTAQQSVSGVNMDEETVSLLRFQQLYQANARVIDAATNVIDTILSLSR